MQSTIIFVERFNKPPQRGRAPQLINTQQTYKCFAALPLEVVRCFPLQISRGSAACGFGRCFSTNIARLCRLDSCIVSRFLQILRGAAAWIRALFHVSTNIVRRCRLSTFSPAPPHSSASAAACRVRS